MIRIIKKILVELKVLVIIFSSIAIVAFGLSLVMWLVFSFLTNIFGLDIK